jgi:hypothetical protein
MPIALFRVFRVFRSGSTVESSVNSVEVKKDGFLVDYSRLSVTVPV